MSRSHEFEARDGKPEDLSRYAEEVAVAAGRASEAAERWRAEWLATQNAKEAAWRAYEGAMEAARRAYRAAAFPTPQVPLTEEEKATRERYLHRVAREAYRRGELSLSQLNDALSHRNGWDPHLHPIEQQLVLHRLALARKLDVYRTVSDIERDAWQAAEVAEAAKYSLRREAYSAQTLARSTVDVHTRLSRVDGRRARAVDRPARSRSTVLSGTSGVTAAAQ